MYKKLSALCFVMVLLFTACGNNEENKDETVVTDTVVKTETIIVEKDKVIDSAAIAAYYDAAHSKSKGKHQVSHVAHPNSKKMVLVDSHEPIEHHDVLTIDAPPAPSTDPAVAQTQPTVIVVHDKETIYFRPDEKASFPGGEKAFDEYIIKRLKYPQEALERGITGTVYATVYLDELGKITKVETNNNQLGWELEAETKRLLLASPRWNPAKHAGTPVKSKFIVPVTFEIKG